MKQWLPLALVIAGLGCSSAAVDPGTPDSGVAAGNPDAETTPRVAADSGTIGRADARVIVPRDAGLRADAAAPDATAGDASSAGDAGTQSGRDAAAGPRPDVGPVPPPANDTCAQAMTLDLSGGTSGRYEMRASTDGAGHEMDGPCAPTGPDIFFKFTLNDRSLVYADTFGASWDTVLYFANDCSTAMPTSAGAGQSLCNDDACGSSESQVAAVFGPGTYYLALGGARGESGPVTLHFEWAIVGRGPVELAPQGTTMLSGVTSGSGRAQLCEAGGPENSYWWMTCPSDTGGPFVASTCNLTAFDTVAYLQIPRGMIEACSDDSCRFQSRIETVVPMGAGLNVITVDGSSGADLGNYRMELTRP